MAKQGEIDYLRNIGHEGVIHAVNKPFSDGACDVYLMRMGVIFSLLPPPPARLLDVGCGTGWTSLFYARRGYDVVGLDIAADMIREAEAARQRTGLENVSFQVGDYETTTFDGQFDAAVFFDALHHAIDEAQALRMVFRSLRPGGVCVTSEPGKGHADADASVEARRKYNVTEKDMPPRHIIEVGRRVGFRKFRTYPHADQVKSTIYSGQSGRWLGKLRRRWPWIDKLASAAWLAKFRIFDEFDNGMVLLVK